jgi:hypothetical protein
LSLWSCRQRHPPLQAQVRPPLMPRKRVLEVTSAGLPDTDRHGALAVSDLDQVTQGVGRLVAAGFVAVVAVGDRDGPEPDP